MGDGAEHERGYIVAAEDLPVLDELLHRVPSHPPSSAAVAGEGEEPVAAVGARTDS